MKNYDVTEKLIHEVKKVIVGKDEVLSKVWMTILARGHVLLDDVPGVGKTTMAMGFSRALGLDVKRIQFTPDTMPSDITGFSVFENGLLKYQEGAVMTNLLLADEINRTSAKTQSALLESMEEGHVTVDGTTYALPAPFIVLATQNPVGSAGTQNLPSSQLDRFMMKLSIGYPDHSSQVELMKARHVGNPLDQVESILTKEELLSIIDEVEQTYIADGIYDYIALLCEATRTNDLIRLGVSPRASLALCRAAKAKAFLEKRDYVIPEDVAACASDVFSHRLVLSSKAKLHDYTAEALMEEILSTIPKPILTEQI
ncbi:MAG: MoxR family ATPase [Lachnospiraceae bacterium]|nr:MoxR family ATPase [Lachnospiraceae bacterium]